MSSTGPKFVDHWGDRSEEQIAEAHRAMDRRDREQRQRQQMEELGAGLLLLIMLVLLVVHVVRGGWG